MTLPWILLPELGTMDTSCNTKIQCAQWKVIDTQVAMIALNPQMGRLLNSAVQFLYLLIHYIKLELQPNTYTISSEPICVQAQAYECRTNNALAKAQISLHRKRVCRSIDRLLCMCKWGAITGLEKWKGPGPVKGRGCRLSSNLSFPSIRNKSSIMRDERNLKIPRLIFFKPLLCPI